MHRTPVDEVHLHEVGDLEAIADIVGVCTAMADLGVDRVLADRVTVGSDTVRTEHGMLPVAISAVVDVLSTAGATMYAGLAERELCTSTSAALLAMLGDGWGPVPPMRVTGSGAGAGTADLTGTPNVVCVVLGLTTADDEGAVVEQDRLVLEANVDDLDPRQWPGLLNRLVRSGADGVWLTAILMRKGRLVHQLGVLAGPAFLDAVRTPVFAETSAIGARVHEIRRHAVPRIEETVECVDLPSRGKVALEGRERVNEQPEYDDLVMVAEVTGTPLKVVLARAVSALTENRGYTHHNLALALPRPTEGIPSGSEVP